MKRVEPRILNQKFARFPTPTAAVLELTNRCNEKCIHCIRESPTLRFSDELSTEEWLAIVDELARIHTFSICLTGGECTIHPGFMEIIERCRSHRINISIKTNALSLHRLAPILAEKGVGFIEVSLYGATPATHDRCTRIPGSFRLLVDGVKAARLAGIPISLNAVVFRWNAHEVLAMKELGRSLDCNIKRDYMLTNTDIGRHLDTEMATPAQMREIEAVWPMNTLPGAQNQLSKVKICAQGMNSIAVTARGEILSCVTIRKPLGHFRKERLTAVWHRATGGHSGSPKRAHDIDYSRFTRCESCDFLPVCNVCLGQNYSATGSFYEPPLERCYIAMTLFGSAGEQSSSPKDFQKTSKEIRHA